MQITDWNEFYRSLAIIPGDEKPVPKPTPAQLGQFELATGMKLPKSYQEFILVFGPGELFWNLQIAAPGYPNASKVTYDLATANQMFGYRPHEAQGRLAPHRDRLARLYYFGLENGRNWLGWDIGDVREPAEHEYGIYRVGLAEVTFLAPSFRRLIEIMNEQLLVHDPEWDEEELGPRCAFSPATQKP